MDIIDVQNRDRRKTFGKIRRALGVFAELFGINDFETIYAVEFFYTL